MHQLCQRLCRRGNGLDPVVRHVRVALGARHGAFSYLNICNANHSLKRNSQGPEALFEATAQALLNGVDRDALSGWGAVVHVITKDQVITRTLKGRMD